MSGTRGPPVRSAVLAALAVFGAGLSTLTVQGPAAAVEAPRFGTVQEQVIVGFPLDDPVVDAAVRTSVDVHHGVVMRVDERLEFAVVAVGRGDQSTLVEALEGISGVRYAEPERHATITYRPNDALYPLQYGPRAIGAETAWDTSLGSHGRRVAVLDTGVSLHHPDLVGNVCSDASGWNYIQNNGSPLDDHGHGTHVAGIIGAEIDNGEGIAGIANACILAVKVCDASGSCPLAALASGIAHATAQGAHVVNMSLGAPGPLGSAVETAIADAWQNGVLLVAAAGNGSCGPVDYPAAYEQVVAVGALDVTGQRAWFSDCGPQLELAAPGVDILSTWTSGYRFLSGTSMASPHVAGAAALVWDQAPTRTHDEIRCVLQRTADDLGTPGRDSAYGYGRVDVAEAIGQVARGCPVRSASKLYLTGSDVDAGLSCPVSVFSRCIGPLTFEVQPGESEVDILIADDINDPVGGFAYFRDTAGNPVGSGVALCREALGLAVPAEAVELRVLVDVAFGPLDCFGDLGVATTGTVNVRFS